MITEPYSTTKKKKEDSFVDYENILPQDRLVQAQETGQPDINSQPPAIKRTPDDILNEIYSYRPPTPTYDPNRPEELRRLARASAIGKGLNVLGDVIGLSAGANINPRPDDQRELGYLQSMYNYVDDYNRRMDEWNWRDFTTKLKAGELALSEANLKEERALRERMFESQEKWKELGFVSEQAWRQFQAEKAQETQDLAREKFEVDTAYKEMTATERKRHNEQMEISSMLRAEAQAIRAQKPSASTKTYTLYDSKGNPVELDENEREKIMSLILEDPLTKLTQDEIDLLKPKLGQPFSTNTMNNIVQKYWEKTPSSHDYVYSKYGKPGESEQKSGETDVKQKWGQYAR
jgi:hypothetical protein